MSKEAEAGSGKQEARASAMERAAWELGKAGNAYEALQLAASVVQEFDGRTEVAIREVVASALQLQAFVAAQQGRLNDAVRIYDRILRAFRPETPALRHTLALGLLLRGVALQQTARESLALASYSSLIELFAEDGEPLVRLQVATALCYRAGVFHASKRAHEEWADYLELEQRFGLETHPSIRYQVACGGFNCAVFLADLGRMDEAVRTLDGLLNRYVNERGPKFLELLGRTRALRHELRPKYDPDPLHLGLSPDLRCVGCGRDRYGECVSFDEADIIRGAGVCEIKGVPCSCGATPIRIGWLSSSDEA